MRERPPLPDPALVAALAAGWGVAAAALAHLPVGDDARAWSFLVTDGDGGRWFLKVRHGRVDPATVLVPAWLADHGLEQVVAVIPTLDGGAWRRLGHFTLLLYPWVDGVSAMRAGLTDRQWVAYGGFVRALHQAAPPARLAAAVPRESFAAWWEPAVRRLQARVEGGEPGDPLQRELARLWRERRAEIALAAGRARRLGRAVAAARLPLVLCHADVHLDNLLVTPGGRLRVVDWDGLVWAPREQDLSFVVGQVGDREQALFLEGYGEVVVDRPALAFYRYQWVVQEVADYGGRVLDERLGEATRRRALAELRQLFAPGDVLEAARRADPEPPVR